MQQIIQNYKTGELKIEEVPRPILKTNGILVRSIFSLISAGTEKSKVELAKKNILEKIKARPDQLSLVLNNIKQEGLWLTFKKACIKLDTPISLGYSMSGVVIDVAEQTTDFKIGDRVSCVGEGYAAHAQINFVPCQMCVRIPEALSFEEASFAGLGAIAFQATELAQLQQAENVAVIGLGLLGQLVTQISKAKGCKVLGIEIDSQKIELAKNLGLDCGANLKDDDVEELAKGFSSGCGIDTVIITAASKDNQPLALAGRICRDKARVILVGAVPITIPRKDFYEKEITFIISRGFGAGLYYKIQDNRRYPYNYKPITIKENMQSFLMLAAERKIDVKPLVTHRFNIEEAKQAYELIKTNKEKYIGIIFNYSQEPSQQRRITLNKGEVQCHPVKIGFIGAGSFSQGYILPILKKISGLTLVGVNAATGISSKNTARKFGFSYCASNYKEIINDPEVNCIFIATRHNLHASMAAEALKNKKIVFVEKPLAVNPKELREIIQAYKENNGKLMIGFNRRFSPFVKRIKEFYKNRNSPLMINYRVNAGYLPAEHWVHDPKQGAGRIIAEVCHFVDLLQFLTGASCLEVYAQTLGSWRLDMPEEDNISVILKFSDGSVGSITYCATGDTAFARERVEVFGENSVAVIDNFRRAKFVRRGKTQGMFSFNRDMGHYNELFFFIKAVTNNNPMPINFDEIVLATWVTFKIRESLETKEPKAINLEELGLS